MSDTQEFECHKRAIYNCIDAHFNEHPRRSPTPATNVSNLKTNNIIRNKSRVRKSAFSGMMRIDTIRARQTLREQLNPPNVPTKLQHKVVS